MWRPNASSQRGSTFSSKKSESEYEDSSSDNTDNVTFDPVSQRLHNKVKTDIIDISGKK
jgi:hypothetical protein